MSYVLTLIGKPGTETLTEELAAHIHRALDKAGMQPTSAPHWLAADTACDIPLTSAPREDTYKLALEALEGAPIDIACQPAEGRKKKLLVADMESTIIGQECLDELADFVGLRHQIAGITAKAMNGEIDFDDALCERVSLLKGLDVDVLERVYQERVTLNPGARALIATMRANGATCELVSGGFTFFADRIAADTGFDHVRANSLVIENHKLSGDVLKPILGRAAKLDALLAARAENGLNKIETIAVGDGANDLDMICEAGLGVAYYAKPVVAERAQAQVSHADLTALLYMQGYRADEFVS